jgi:uncharacterized membrane protein
LTQVKPRRRRCNADIHRRFSYINYLGIVELIGAILFSCIAWVRQHIQTNGIFDNHSTAIAGIVGVVLAVVVGIAIVPLNVEIIMKIYPVGMATGQPFHRLSKTPKQATSTLGDYSLHYSGNMDFAILWIFAIIATFFIRRSLKQLSDRTNVGLFSTTGLLLLAGAVLFIIFGLGAILIWIASLILAIAFFTMKPHEAPPPPM